MIICDEDQLDKIRQDAADKKKNKRLLDIRQKYGEYIHQHMEKAYDLDDFWYQTAGESLTEDEIEEILNIPDEYDEGDLVRAAHGIITDQSS
jgi:hypothetical protein